MNGSVYEQGKSSIHTIPCLNDSSDWSATIGENNRTKGQMSSIQPLIKKNQLKRSKGNTAVLPRRTNAVISFWLFQQIA